MASTSHETGQKPVPALSGAVRVWAQIGILSFGGPTAQISLMHRMLVEERGWLTEKQFLHALSFCMLLPGPEAMQLATYAGWRLHGTLGGLIAGLLFVVPGALIILALSMIYAAFGSVPFVEALFLGVKAAVLVIVIEALLRISKRALHSAAHWVIAALSFLAIFALALPYPLIIFIAALYGYWRFADSELQNMPTSIAINPAKTLQTVIVWTVVWIAPLAAMVAILGKDHILASLGLFFSKLAVVTFGGAYAVLAYMGQDVVTRHEWLEAQQMMDGLGLAETTPGPLILVTEFVGYLAAYRDAGGAAWLAGIAGIAGAMVALWATFAPCFLWIFAGAPYIDWLNTRPRLKGALSAITAAVVGVILNLSIWFGLHVFFSELTKWQYSIFTLLLPNVTSLDLQVVILATISGYLLLWRHWSIPWVLLVAAVLALGMEFVLLPGSS